MPLPKDPEKLELWKKRQSIAHTGKKQSEEHIKNRRMSLMTGLYKANTVICANCGEKLKRIPCRAKGRNYCNNRCQMIYEYTNGIRDPKEITEKAHIRMREMGKEGIHPFQKKEVRDKIRETMQTPEYREKERQAHLGNKNGMYHVYGEEHPQYKHGKTKLHKLLWNRVEYKEWRKAIYERDNYTCQFCGDDKGGNLEAHHKKSFKDFPELRYDVDNGITLCQTCHREVHRKVVPSLIPLLIE